MAVARKASNSDVYTGKHARYGVFYLIVVVDENTIVHDEEDEMLLMGNVCPWDASHMHHQANQVHFRLEHLFHVMMSKKRFYVTRVKFEGVYLFGYYK